jgi:hypothetical protein
MSVGLDSWAIVAALSATTVATARMRPSPSCGPWASLLPLSTALLVRQVLLWVIQATGRIPSRALNRYAGRSPSGPPHGRRRRQRSSSRVGREAAARLNIGGLERTSSCAGPSAYQTLKPTFALALESPQRSVAVASSWYRPRWSGFPATLPEKVKPSRPPRVVCEKRPTTTVRPRRWVVTTKVTSPACESRKETRVPGRRIAFGGAWVSCWPAGGARTRARRRARARSGLPTWAKARLRAT